VPVPGARRWPCLIARNGYPTLLWGHDPARMAALAHERENSRYLPGTRFPTTCTSAKTCWRCVKKRRTSW